MALFYIAICLVTKIIKDNTINKLFCKFKYKSIKTIIQKLGVKYKLKNSNREVLIGI